VFLALFVQHAMGMQTQYIVICGLSGCTVFFYASHNRENSVKKVNENKLIGLIFSTNSALFLVSESKF